MESLYKVSNLLKTFIKCHNSLNINELEALKGSSASLLARLMVSVEVSW